MAIVTPTRFDFDAIGTVLKIFQDRSNIEVRPDDGLSRPIGTDFRVGNRLRGTFIREITALIDMLGQLIPETTTGPLIYPITTSEDNAKNVNHQILSMYESLFTALLWNNDIEGRARNAMLEGWYHVKIRGMIDAHQVLRDWATVGADLFEGRHESVANFIMAMAHTQLVFPQLTAFSQAQNS